MSTSAVYGIPLYGESTYGQVFTPEEPLVARSYEYDKVELSWVSSEVPHTRAVIERSTYGYPITKDEGLVILDLDEDGIATTTEFVDEVPGGRPYYYTMFILTDPDEEWIVHAQVLAFPVRDSGIEEDLWNLMPAYYRDADDSTQLLRFLSLFSFELNLIENEYSHLANFNNIENIHIDMLPAIAAQLGADVEPRLGWTITRKYIKNLIFLYKWKGTIIGVEGLASTLTNWPVEAQFVTDTVHLYFQAERTNLVPNPSFETNLTGWSAGTGTTASRVATNPYAGDYSARVTRTGGAGTGTATFYLPDDAGYSGAIYGVSTYNSKLYTATPEDGTASALIPFELNEANPLRSYTASIHHFPTESREAAINLFWFNDDKEIIGSERTLVTTVADEHNRVTVYGNAPADTGYISLSYEIYGVEEGEYHYLDAVMLEESSRARTYFDGSTPADDDHDWDSTSHASISYLYANKNAKIERLDALLPYFLPPDVEWEYHYNEDAP